MTLQHHQRDWNEIVEEDQLWAILSDDTKAGGSWDVEEFFETGTLEIASVMARAEALGYPRSHGQALDFGCGAGRVTRAIARHFETVLGLDISPLMIESAKRFNETCARCKFEVNESPDLGRFADGQFDFVYSNIVLQHVPTSALIEGYVREFVRVLAPGGLLVFQLPSSIPWRYRLQPRRRAYALLRTFRTSPAFLRRRLGLHPIRMNAIAESQVVELLDSAGAELKQVDRSTDNPFAISSCTYWVTRP